MKYERAKLVGRNWHKIVFEASDRFHFSTAPQQLKEMVNAALTRLTGDFMAKNMGYTYVVMIDTEDDLVMMRIMTGFTSDEYRGCGDWANRKYHTKEGNRIKRES